MQETDWKIIQNYWDYTEENVLFTYDEAEAEQNKIAKNNAKLILNPKFIPIYPKLLQDGYSFVESALLWFIDFFLGSSDRFYCTNEQLSQLLNCSCQTISTAIKSLESKWDIVLHKKIKSWGGTIRFITLGNQKIWFWEIQKSHWIYNKIIENKKNNNIIINNNTEQSSEIKNQTINQSWNQICLNSSLVEFKEKEKSSVKKEKESMKEITLEINDLIWKLKDICNQYWVAYDNTKDRMFAKHILTAKDYWEFCEKNKQDRVTFACNVLLASIKINYWKGALSWPMKIYQNYADLYNQTKQKAAKTYTPTIQVL